MGVRLKKLRNGIFLILLISIIIIRIFYKPTFYKIKSSIKKQINLYYLSTIYTNIYNGKTTISNNNYIICKDYKRVDDTYEISSLGGNVVFPFKGLITYKDNDTLGITISKDITFYYSNIKPKRMLYTQVNENDVLGISDNYYIYSNNALNMKYLNFKTDYNEI